MGDTSEASYCNGQIDRAAFGNGCAGPIASSFSYTTVTVPGITGAQFTGINNIGQISGYGGAGEVKTGLILNSNGTVSTVYQPDSTGTKALPGCHS